MYQHRLLLAGLIVVGVTGAYAGSRLVFPAAAVDPPAPPPAPAANPAPQKQTPAPSAAETGVKQATEDYVKAFNAHDAKAAAALWTENGEYVGVDGETFRGRAAIEKSLAEDFKAFPKSSIQIQLTSVRPIGRQTALAEGTVTVKNPGDTQPNETRYSALQVFEDGMWRAASVREWVPDPNVGAAKTFLDGLVGEWSGKGSDGTISITYSWNDTQSFLFGKYSILKDGKTTSTGTEILTRDPVGGIRSWTFDSSGTFCNGLWQRDGNGWVDRAIGVLPNGVEIDSVNVLIPLGPDAFSWQTTERCAATASP